MDKDKQIAEVFTWAKKMRERLEQFASATCAGLHGGDCGECFSCKARKDLSLTLPQAYAEWSKKQDGAIGWGEDFKNVISFVKASLDSEPHDDHDIYGSVNRASSLTLPQAYIDWASRMGAAKDIMNHYQECDSCGPDGGGHYINCAKYVELWARLEVALSDQEGK